ncbi:MAG TPA: FdhF/YdeP family oxidoreductase [Sandaracinaceae bacterium]
MRKGKVRIASLAPFGIGAMKPNHYAEMAQIAWRNRGKWGYAWRVLNDGVCDGCALGTSGLRDWTLDGTHLCLVRLNLLELNTMDGFDPSIAKDVSKLPRRAKELRELGRIPVPLRRRAGEAGFSPVSWDEALAELGARLRASDPDRIACYMTSRGLTNEVYYAAQKAWRLLGSPHIDNAARLCHSPSTAAMKAVLGVGASTCSYRDWYGTDVVVFFGSNPANDQPVALKYLYDAKKLGTRVLVVNTYEEPGLASYWIPSNAGSALFGTKIADRFFHVTAGGDLAFAYAVSRLLIERGAIEREFLEAHTEGFEEFHAHLERYELDQLVARSGASREDVEAFADELARAKTGVFVWSMGITQHGHGTESVAAILCLGLLRAFVGREKCGLMPIRGHSGVQGGAEMGAYANVFPGGVPITEAEADRLEALWGFRPPSRVGLDTVAMIEAAERGELDVMYAVGGNFVDTLPQPERVERALANVPVRIHQDIVLTPKMLLPAKDVVYVLPAKTRYESVGGVTETTTERRVIYSPYVPGHEVGEAREEWRIVRDLVHAAWPEKAALLDFPDAAAIRADIARTIPAYAPIATLANKGDQFQWGGPRLCEGGEFPLPGGKARFRTFDPPDLRPREEGELYLTTRRGKQFNSIVQAEVDRLTGAARDHVLMSRADMDRLGLHGDQEIELTSPYGTMRGRVFEAKITPGNVQAHWPEANVLLDPRRVDPGGKVPDYGVRVRVRAL